MILVWKILPLRNVTHWRIPTNEGYITQKGLKWWTNVTQWFGVKTKCMEGCNLFINAHNNEMHLSQPNKNNYPGKLETVKQCWINVGPQSSMLAQQQPNIGTMSCACWEYVPQTTCHDSKHCNDTKHVPISGGGWPVSPSCDVSADGCCASRVLAVPGCAVQSSQLPLKIKSHNFIVYKERVTYPNNQ